MESYRRYRFNRGFRKPFSNASQSCGQPDGSLPDNGFARLKKGSDLIDRSIDVGLPFIGSSPDLGAYEFGEVPVEVTRSNRITNPSISLHRFRSEMFDLSGRTVTRATPYTSYGIRIARRSDVFYGIRVS